MKTKKLLSLLLALMMMLSVVPFYASAAEALSATNVIQWPTILYKNADGKMYYGQTQEEALIINDDEVVQDANGNVVDGHFEFIDPSLLPTSDGTKRADIKFIPEDTSSYVGFEAKRCRNVTYVVSETTPVYVDEVNDPLIATEVEAGATLSTSILSGGKMINPYNPEEPEILARTWEWSNPNTVVNESGYYEAMFVPASYTKTTVQVYVRIAGSIPETTITEMPTISNFTYDPNISWKDIEISGGKAVLKVEGTVVAGTFTVADKAKDWVPIAGTHTVPVVFTPNDLEAALPYSFEITNVVVSPAPIAFIDNEGNVVDDFTFEVEPGTKMGDVRALLNAVLRIPANSVISVEDSNSYAQNGRTYKLTVLYDENSNYTGNELYFTVKFKNVELTPTITAIGLNKFKVNCGDYSPAGTFTITCNGEEVATVKANQDFNCEVWTDNGGSYEIKAKYNPTENDYFIISDAEWAKTVYAKRNLKAPAMTYTVNGDAYASEIRANDIIVAKTSYEDFAHYVIKDGSGKEIVLEGVDLTSREITFAMPDHDLTIEIKTNKQIEMEEAAANCDHICHSENPLLQMIWKILHFIFRLFNVQQYCDCGNLHYDAPLFG